MSGVYGGAQAILRNKTTNPVPFVHCSTHNLCLVIKDAVAATNHTSDFFDCLGQVNTLYCFSTLRKGCSLNI
jgi:hypothetical protein